MPEEFKNIKITILCNDCLKTSEAPFDPLG